jgi:protoporphyrin/coproporphyrin ferrochelatase
MAEKAILLANLGSPNSTSVKDVKTYLDEFLMDERVIDVPYWLRYFLVKGLIVPFRASKSAAKYKTIWTENGSPLIHITRQLVELVEAETAMPTYMCMRYATPAPVDVLRQIAKDHPNLTELVLLPLYPHYAMSSFETAVLHVQKAHKEGGYPFSLKVVQPFFKHVEYIAALSESIRPFLKEPYDHILFSYHGTPERHVRKTDPTGNHCLKCTDCCNVPSPAHAVCYRHQIIETTKRVASFLQIPEDKFSFSFQSRLGSDQWLKPYTVDLFKTMPENGIKNLIVVCPAFVSDCLETLEEIWVEGKEDFLHAGGDQFRVVPCLNTDPSWVKTIHTLIKEVV